MRLAADSLAGMAPGTSILFVGDVVGRTGRQALQAVLPLLREELDPTFVVVNGENAAGGIGIPGLYVTGDPGGIDDDAKIGKLGIRIGLGWAKSHHFMTGQCPVMKYHRQLMQAILYDKIKIAKAVNVQVISLDDAPKGYEMFKHKQDNCIKVVLKPGMTGDNGEVH